MNEYYQQFLDYIRNTGGSPLIEWFDEDWEPIGQIIRGELKTRNLIYEKDGKVYLSKEDKTDGRFKELVASGHVQCAKAK